MSISRSQAPLVGHQQLPPCPKTPHTVNAKHTQCHHLHCLRPIIINTRRMHRVWILPSSVSGMVLMAKLSQITSTPNALSMRMYSEVALNLTLLPAGKVVGLI